MSNIFADLPTLTLAVKVSVPEALSVNTAEFNHGVTNSIVYQVMSKIRLNTNSLYSVHHIKVNFQELQHYDGQLEPGFITTSVDVSLHVSKMSCRHIQIS